MAAQIFFAELNEIHAGLRGLSNLVYQTLTPLGFTSRKLATIGDLVEKQGETSLAASFWLLAEGLIR
jgi:hypothetical protein